MKTRNKTTSLLATILGLSLLVLSTWPAAAQVTPEDSYTAVASVTVTNAQTLTVTSNSFSIPRGGGLGVYLYTLGTNANAAKLNAALRTSIDRTNWSTTTINLTNVMNGTTATRSYHSIGVDSLRGATWGSILTLANEHTNAVTASVTINR